MTWHPAYVGRVLTPDHAYAATHLYPAFLDALTAHVRTVARLDAARPHAAAIAALDAALHRQRALAPPPPEPGVPDLYFALQKRLIAALATSEASVRPATGTEEAADAAAETLAWLRLGLSRNDLDMTVYVLAARDGLLRVARRSLELQAVLLQLAAAHVETVLIATTHHQPAQPTTLGHYLAAAAAVAGRDLDRVLGALRRIDRCPLGAAALAGSSHPLDRDFTARALGFAEPVANTYDAVAAADWQLDVAALGQTLGVNLSRLVHDLVAAASDGWLRLPDDLVQGSSIMPQKRNPVTLEHARTRCSRAAGAAQAIVFSGHNVHFGDVNDIGPDVQEAIHTVIDALEGALDLLIACLRGASIDREALAARALATDTTATELADELVRSRGVAFPAAHRTAAALVQHVVRRGLHLQQATPDDLAACGGPPMANDALAEALSPAAFVARRAGVGGPAPDAVRSQIGRSAAELARYHQRVDAMTARIDAAHRDLRAPGKDTPA
jgi:argininosuccinate lyase